MGLAGPAGAQPASFPADGKFVAANCKTGKSDDKVKDAAGALNERDIVGDAKHPALFTYDDGTYFYVRVRLDADPIVSKGGNAPLAQFGWGVGLDTNSDKTNIEFAAVVNGITEKVNLTDNVDKKNALKSWSPTLKMSGKNITSAYVEVKKANDGSKFNGTDDYFLTFAVHMKEASDATKSANDPLNWGKIAIWIGTSSNGHTLDKDYMCWDDTTGNVKLDQAATNEIIIGTYVDVTSPSASPVTSTTPTLAGTAEPGVTVTLTLNGKTTTVTADKDGKWSFKVPADWKLEDGKTYSLKAEVKDDGTGASASTTVPVIVELPAFVKIDSLGSKPINTTTPTVTGTSKPNAKVTVSINGKSQTVTTDKNGKWSLKVPADWKLTSDTTYKVTATTDDGKGGTVKDESGFSIEAPHVVIVEPKSGAADSETPTISGTAHPGAKVKITINGFSMTVTADKNGKWTLKTTVDFALQFGKSYTIKAETTRNGATAKHEKPLVITKGGFVTITGPGKDPVTTTEPTLTGTAKAGAKVTLKLNGKTTTVTADKDGKWSFKVPKSWGLENDKSYPLEAEVDDGGKKLTAKATVKVEAPEVAITGPKGDKVTSTTPTVSGTAHPGADVKVTINGKSQTVKADSKGKWSLKVPASFGLQDGKTYTVDAETTRNKATAKASKKITVDEPLTITIDKPAGNTVGSTTPTIGGKTAPGATVVINLNGKNTSVTADKDGNWSFKVPKDWGLQAGKKYKIDVEVNTNNKLADAAKDITVVDTCSDKKLNGDETDIDCGGTCPTKCVNGKLCKVGGDCKSGTCDDKKNPKVCSGTDPCTDKKVSGDETDVDCGGSCSTKCELGKKCKVAADCKTANCDAKTKLCAKAASCTDGKMNGDETDVDCGGSCKTSCDNGKKCKIDGDCKSKQCNLSAKQPICKANAGCSNGKLDGDETDVDCGGSCPTKCDDGKGCMIAKDCKSGSCDNSKSNPVCGKGPSCSDGIYNGDETDVDCGGSCKTKCDSGFRCKIGGDCKSGKCDENALLPLCIEPASCTNGKKDGDETDIDCGGSCVDRCKNGEECKVGNDCMSGSCDAKKKPPVCFEPGHCTNNKKDGDETDVDCGGSCAAKCLIDEGCKTGKDCASKLCDTAAQPNICMEPPTCTNGKKDGDETDVDCGGSCKARCKETKGCKVDGDCEAALSCGTKKTCEKKPSCTDGQLNGDETDVDCGGSCKTKCKDDKLCAKNDDCESANCVDDGGSKRCKPGASCTDSKQNGDETDVDCGGSCPTKCDDDKGCKVNKDCKSDSCDATKTPNVCKKPAACDDGVQNGNETDVDCGGSCKDKCDEKRKCKVDDDCKSLWCGGDNTCRPGCPDAKDPTDCDDDGLKNKDEDKNNDGKIDDGETNPFDGDQDKDGIKDGEEVAKGTDPTKADLKLVGGGCSAAHGSGPGGPPTWPILLGLLCLAVARRRRNGEVL